MFLCGGHLEFPDMLIRMDFFSEFDLTVTVFYKTDGNFFFKSSIGSGSTKTKIIFFMAAILNI